MTARCTSPFFTLARGIASLTETTITSPTEAVFRLEPPSTLMHCTRRAPELSATSRFVSGWIIAPPPSRHRRRRRRGRCRRHLGAVGLAVAADHHPALPLGDRRVLLDLHHVALLAEVRLVVGGVLLRPPDELLVERVHHATLDEHGDRLVHLVADHPAREDSLRHRRRPPLTPWPASPPRRRGRARPPPS